MIANEQESSTVPQIELHAYQALGVSRQVVKGNALAEIEGPLVKGLPVAVRLLALLTLCSVTSDVQI